MAKTIKTTRTWEPGDFEWSGTTSTHYWFEVEPGLYLETTGPVETPEEAADLRSAAAGANGTIPMKATERYVHMFADTFDVVGDVN